MPRPKLKTETTPDQHKARHVELHKALDELLADFITHNPAQRLSNTTLMDLLQWSHAQTISPTERTK